jgi:hypothetical protein
MAPSAHAYEDVVILNVEQFNISAVRRDARVYHLVEHLLDAGADLFGRQAVAFVNLGRRIEMGSDGRSYALADLPPVFRPFLGYRDRVTVKLYHRYARYAEESLGQVVFFRFFRAIECSLPGINRPVDRESAYVNILPVNLCAYLNIIRDR